MLVVRAGDAALGDELAGAVARGLTERGVEVRRPARPEPPPPDRALEQARAAYHALDPEQALRELEAWVARAERSGDAGSRERWIEGLLWLALAHLALADPEGADAALDRALAVEAELVLDPARYPPTLRDRLQARRAQPRARATLRVDAVPPGARVQIDGEPRGVAPLAVEVPVGRHLVRVSARASRPEGRAVDVGPEGASVTLAVSIDPELAWIDAGAAGAPLTQAARDAAQASDERVLVLDLLGRPGALRAVLHEQGGGRRAAAGPSASAHALAAGLLSAWDAAAPGSPAPGSPAPGSLAPGSAAVADDPLPWIGVGVGAAIVTGVAIGIGVAVSSQPSGFTAVGTRE